MLSHVNSFTEVLSLIKSLSIKNKPRAGWWMWCYCWTGIRNTYHACIVQSHGWIPWLSLGRTSVLFLSLSIRSLLFPTKFSILTSPWGSRLLGQVTQLCSQDSCGLAETPADESGKRTQNCFLVAGFALNFLSLKFFS